MFSMYIIIDHNKLLKKSSSFDEKELITTLSSIVRRNGGLISSLSEYMCFFPSNYDYSKKKFLFCLNEIHKLLLNNHDIVGFSLIVDDFQPNTDFEFLERQKSLNLQTIKNDRIWFSRNAFELVSDMIPGEKIKELYLIDDFSTKSLISNNRLTGNINNEVQEKLKKITNKLNYFNQNLENNLYDNIIYWSKERSFQKVFTLDFIGSSDNVLSILDFLISYKDDFNPERDLSDEEKINWSIYIDLYNNISKRTYSNYILDDSIVHFKRLILLWFESFCSRYKTLFIFKITGSLSDEMDQLWTLLSVVNNLYIFVFMSDTKNISNLTVLPPLPGLNDSLNSGLNSYLKEKDKDSLMMLYLITLIKGTMLISDILKIFKNLNYNELILTEEIENYKRDGLLLGDKHLFPTSDKILLEIINSNELLVEKWKNLFLRQFLVLKFNHVLNYSYIFSLIGLNSDYKSEALDTLFCFIQKLLDLGRPVRLSPEILNLRNNIIGLSSILQYMKIRESRKKNSIIMVDFYSNKIEDKIFNNSLVFLDILNNWSLNNDEDLINKCKDLYFIYQTNGDQFKESRIKTIFALSLLSVGRVGESVDYFELNCHFSKSISDTYSYIRNGCFLAMSLFIKGDISGVLRVTNEFLNYNWIHFNTRWSLYLKFIRSRAYIELGNHESSLTLLDEAIIQSKKFNYDDITNVLINWKGWVLFLLSKVGEAREIILSNKTDNEGYFFLSQIEYFSGNNKKALDYINKVDFINDNTILYDDNLIWRDGYFLIEEFFDRNRTKSVLNEEVTNFKYLLKIINGDKETYETFSEIISNISNNSQGIYNYKYLFYLYLSRENEHELNMDNLLNKVIRLLQQRASNLAEHNQKHLYLNNFFNHKIIEESERKNFFN